MHRAIFRKVIAHLTAMTPRIRHPGPAQCRRPSGPRPCCRFHVDQTASRPYSRRLRSPRPKRAEQMRHRRCCLFRRPHKSLEQCRCRNSKLLHSRPGDYRNWRLSLRRLSARNHRHSPFRRRRRFPGRCSCCSRGYRRNHRTLGRNPFLRRCRSWADNPPFRTHSPFHYLHMLKAGHSCHSIAVPRPLLVIC